MIDDLHSDADGRVVLPRVMRSQPVQVRVRGDGIIAAFHTIEPGAGDDCEIVVERRCHFRIESSDPKRAAAAVQLETGAGETAWISTASGIYNQQIRLVDGRTAVLGATELATTLIVDDELRVPVKLIPGEIVVIDF